MRILQVSNFFKPSLESGGVANVVYNISKCLVKRGHELTVYTTNRSLVDIKIDSNRLLDYEGMKVYFFSNLRKYFPIKIPPIPYYLPRVARKEIKNFDVIHIHEARTIAAVFTYYYAQKYNIPYIVQAHGSVMPFFQKVLFKKIFDRIWGYNILKHASKVIAGTDEESKQYMQMGVKKNRIEIVPNAVNFSQFENTPKGMFRRKYGIKETDKMILYLGRINKIKGIDFLLDSFRQVCNKYNNVKLVLIGPDDGFLSEVKTQMREIGKEKIIYTGIVSEKTKFEAYADADIYVLPSVKDNFPISVLEALASGTPVIVTNRCLIANIVQDVGFVVDYDPSSLNKAIIDLLNNDELRLILGEKSRSLIKSKFTYDKICEQLIGLYEKIR